MKPVIIPHEEAPQGSDRWMDIRLGIPTASEFSKIVKADGSRSKQREAYMEKLADERLRRMVENMFESSAMKRGKIMEPESRETFETAYGVEVTQVSFVYADERKRYGCSPDGLIFDGDSIQYGFETKDAESSVQEERLKADRLPCEHFHQVHGSMLVCNVDHWYFRSYCRGMRALTKLVPADKKFIRALKIEIEVFCDELDKLVDRRRSA